MKFEIDEAAVSMAQAWLKNHKCCFRQKHRHITWEFNSSSGIGQTAKAKCECGNVHDCTDYSTW